jgi:Dockerin type I domain
MRQIITNQQMLAFAAFSMCVLGSVPRVADAVVIVSSSIIKIADTNTLIPNGGGATFGVFDRPAISGQNVAFFGRATGGGIPPAGVYHNIGALTRVMDNTTPSPFGAGILNANGTVDIAGNVVVFTTGSPNIGVFTSDGGILSVIANTGTPNPAGAGFLTGFDFPTIGTSGVSFQALVNTSFFNGIYTTVGGGGVSRIFDATMLIPGGVVPGPSNIVAPAMSGANTVFSASNSAGSFSCICGLMGGVFGSIISSSDVAPGTLIDSRPAISGENVAWTEGQTGLAGAIRVRARIDGVIGPIAVIGQVAPDSGMSMMRFGDPSIDGDTVSFGANNLAGVFGLFVRIAGQIHTVQLNTQPLDGKTIQTIQMSQFALDSNNIAFKAEFTDGSQGIFMASITVTNTPDIDGDGFVNAADLAQLLANWGSSGSSDLNGDGVVNAADLAQLLASWTG